MKMKYPLDFEWYFIFFVITQILRETENLPPTPSPAISHLPLANKILLLFLQDFGDNLEREKITWSKKSPHSICSIHPLVKFFSLLQQILNLIFKSIASFFLQMFIIFFFPFVNVIWSKSKNIYFRSLLENEISHFPLVAGKEDILWYNWPIVTEKVIKDQLWL